MSRVSTLSFLIRIRREPIAWPSREFSPAPSSTMTECTLTLAADRPVAALLVVQPNLAARNAPVADNGAISSAVIRLRDCFLRSGGEGITVTAGRKVDVHFTNVLVSTEGSLLHARSAAVGSVDPIRRRVKVRLDQVSALVRGGLVHLDSTGTARRTRAPLCGHRGRQLDREHGRPRRTPVSP